jgi:hypothetical protein
VEEQVPHQSAAAPPQSTNGWGEASPSQSSITPGDWGALEHTVTHQPAAVLPREQPPQPERPTPQASVGGNQPTTIRSTSPFAPGDWGVLDESIAHQNVVVPPSRQPLQGTNGWGQEAGSQEHTTAAGSWGPVKEKVPHQPNAMSADIPQGWGQAETQQQVWAFLWNCGFLVCLSSVLFSGENQ